MKKITRINEGVISDADVGLVERFLRDLVATGPRQVSR
jgi:hypothetical protein